MRKYCYECGKEVDTQIVARKEVYNVCGEDIEVDAQVLVCLNCGEDLFFEELDNATLVTAYNEYRKRHKLLLPEEIKQIREQYGLSQRGFAKLLNWGDKTIFRYENGSIQDKVHNSVLLFMREPENMLDYITHNEILLSERQQTKLMQVVEKLIEDKEYSQRGNWSSFFGVDSPSEENGFTVFDYEKFCEMVLFFAHRGGELLKTKLMKLLNYADMVFYKENGISISGAKYAHLPYGPVPENFDLLLGLMAADKVMHIDVVYDGRYESHHVVPDKEMKEGVLSLEELAVMERIYQKFKNFGSVEISNYSHESKGYKSTVQGEIISYRYAKDINFD